MAYGSLLQQDTVTVCGFCQWRYQYLKKEDSVFLAKRLVPLVTMQSALLLFFPPFVHAFSAAQNSATVTIAPTLRSDAFQWSIAGSGGGPNILSELTWWHLLSPGVVLQTRIARNHLVLGAEGTLGPIVSGENTDYDYYGNDRTNVDKHSDNTANGGFLAGTHMGFGYTDILPVARGTLTLDFYCGLYASIQRLVITDGTDYVGTSTTGTPLPGLNATYDASWMGPWIGMSTEVCSHEGALLDFTLRFHYAFFDATANWINRSDFAHPVSFIDRAEGVGVSLGLGASLPLSAALSFTFRGRASIFTTGTGTDRLYHTSLSWTDSLFNGATWKSLALWIGISAGTSRL